MKTGVSGATAVDLVERRQALLGELVLGEAAHHAHPLRRGRAGDLLLEHAHPVCQAGHPVPAQLHVEVEPAPDDVDVVVAQARDDPPAAAVDDFGGGSLQAHHVAQVAHRREAPAGDGDGFRVRVGAVQRR
jgi:hypothetical protein